MTRAAAPEDKRAAAARPTGRRSFSVATLAAVVAAASTPNAALAFGSGIPGYDINQKARDAQRKAINDELAEQRELENCRRIFSPAMPTPGDDRTGEKRKRGPRHPTSAPTQQL